MDITFLGHAGFYVETDATVIIMDPWLCASGAFDSAWFQFPKNSHLFNPIIERFDASPKDKYIFISHEHKDHFDIEFLTAIKNRNFKIILAAFKRSVVLNTLTSINYVCDGIINLSYNDELTTKDCLIKLFINDAELDCDSAILVKTNTRCFLNVNDCKLYDKIERIAKQYGPINIFASQFSGAIWHPVCYDLPTDRYEAISQQKKMSKFLAVSMVLKTIRPTVYLTSAGPPCFLDPMLMPINFQKCNIFPRAAEFINYVKTQHDAPNTLMPALMPGDVLDAETFQFKTLVTPRFNDDEFESYINAYAAEYATYFHNRAQEQQKIMPHEVFVALGDELKEKMQHMHLVNEDIESCLYWKITGCEEMYEVDFKNKKITITSIIADLNQFWMIEAPAWQVHKVLSKELNWPDFVLTFRVKLTRKPDIYHAVIHGFIALDACEISRFCELTAKYHSNKARTIIEFQGKRYSILRWCPHLGGDLSKGWEENGTWVCPRHHWHFDICNQGKCLTSADTIDAQCLDD